MRLSRFVFAAATALLATSQAALMGIDFGSQYIKLALMRTGKPVEVITNIESVRKTNNMISFHEDVRQFSGTALIHASKSPDKVAAFLPTLLGKHVKTEADITAAYGLSEAFYPLQWSVNATRESPIVTLKDTTLSIEEAVAHILRYLNRVAANANDGSSVRDIVLTIPWNANNRERQALLDAAEIAGFRVKLLAHETSAAALQRSMDFDPVEPEKQIIFNMGAKKTEVCVAEFHQRQAGMVKGKTAPVVHVEACAVDNNLGGHQIDIQIAEWLMKRFVDKNPKLSGAASFPRAYKKILVAANKAKHVLSANKETMVSVESFYEDTDLKDKMTRAELEEMIQPSLDKIDPLIDEALNIANCTMANITGVETMGGAWRIPRVQHELHRYFKSHDKEFDVAQHLNGEEAAVTACTMQAVNGSSSFRVRKVFFSDTLSRTFDVEINRAEVDDETKVIKPQFELFPPGSKVGGKKKISMNEDGDVEVKLWEGDKLSATYLTTDIKTYSESDKYKDLGKPKVSAIFSSANGLVTLTSVSATWEELVYPEPEPESNSTDTNSTTNSTETEGEKEGEEGDKKAEGDEEKTVGADGEEKEGEGAKEGEEGEEKKDGEEGSESSLAEEKKEGDELSEEKKKGKPKKVVHKEDISFTCVFELPLPMSQADKKAAIEKLDEFSQYDQDVRDREALENELEAYLYSIRDKLEDEYVEKASTAEDREAILAKVSEYIDWMEMDSRGAKKADFEEKLHTLQGDMDPILERAKELSERPKLIQSVTKGIDKIKVMKKLVEEREWVPNEKVEEASKKLEDFEDWWAKKQEKQAELADHDVPAYTKKEVDSKLKKIAKAFDKLKKMEKPKPKKEKKKKEKKKKKKDAPPAERPTLHEKDEDLSSSKLEDQESIASRVTELSEKKKSAAAEEDFEEAGVLKERIDKLEELSKFLKDEAVRAEEEAAAAAAEAEEKAKAEAEGGGEQPKTEGGEEPKPEGEAEAGAEGEETAQPEL